MSIYTSTKSWLCTNAAGCGCGRTNLIETEAFKHIQNAKGTTYCSFCGKGWVWTGLSELEAERRKTAEMERQRNYAIQRRQAADEARQVAERSVSALRGVVTRTKNRVGKGVCPCCNRSFANVRRHMETKHPDYSGSEE